jgi:hypothetical protein
MMSFASISPIPTPPIPDPRPPAGGPGQPRPEPLPPEVEDPPAEPHTRPVREPGERQPLVTRRHPGSPWPLQ